MPANCTADCASVYLAWWQKCGKDAQVVAFDEGKAKGQLAAMATKCKAVPKTPPAGDSPLCPLPCSSLHYVSISDILDLLAHILGGLPATCE